MPYAPAEIETAERLCRKRTADGRLHSIIDGVLFGLQDTASAEAVEWERWRQRTWQERALDMLALRIAPRTPRTVQEMAADILRREGHLIGTELERALIQVAEGQADAQALAQ